MKLARNSASGMLSHTPTDHTHCRCPNAAENLVRRRPLARILTHRRQRCVTRAAGQSIGSSDPDCDVVVPSKGVSCGRRGVLALTLVPMIAAAASAAAVLPAHAASVDGSLCSRVDASAQSIKTPGSARPWAEKQVYYPEWLFGEWDVKQRFVNFRMPLGEQFVPTWALESAKASEADGGIGSTLEYNLRFYSTLPDTFENNFKMNVGILPSDAVIADRAWNTAAVADATLGYKAVETSEYDTRVPEKQTVAFTRLSPKGLRLGQEVVEIQLTNLRGSPFADADGLVDSNTFCSSELYRQARGSAISEYEFITTYTRNANGRVTARQSEAVYRSPQSPQDILSFQSGGRAVAFYDYELDMVRKPPPADAFGAVACVLTPKGYTQCL